MAPLIRCLGCRVFVLRTVLIPPIYIVILVPPTKALCRLTWTIQTALFTLPTRPWELQNLSKLPGFGFKPTCLTPTTLARPLALAVFHWPQTSPIRQPTKIGRAHV